MFSPTGYLASVLLHCRSADDQSVRRLLAYSDRYMQIYRQHPDCRGKNIMVCKDCLTIGLQGVRLQTLDMPYKIWCFDSGDFTLRVQCRSERTYDTVAVCAHIWKSS